MSAWVKPTAFEQYNEIFRKEDGDRRVLFSFQERGTVLSLGLNIGGSRALIGCPSGRASGPHPASSAPARWIDPEIRGLIPPDYPHLWVLRKNAIRPIDTLTVVLGRGPLRRGDPAGRTGMRQGRSQLVPTFHKQ